jgi:hypothetical protein
MKHKTEAKKKKAHKTSERPEIQATASVCMGCKPNRRATKKEDNLGKSEREIK